MARKTVSLRVSEPGWYKFSIACEEGKVTGNVYLDPKKDHVVGFTLPESFLRKFDNMDMTVSPRRRQHDNRWNNRARKKKTHQGLNHKDHRDPRYRGGNNDGNR